jgi:hypothetical protein
LEQILFLTDPGTHTGVQLLYYKQIGWIERETGAAEQIRHFDISASLRSGEGGAALHVDVDSCPQTAMSLTWKIGFNNARLRKTTPSNKASEDVMTATPWAVVL